MHHCQESKIKKLHVLDSLENTTPDLYLMEVTGIILGIMNLAHILDETLFRMTVTHISLAFMVMNEN